MAASYNTLPALVPCTTSFPPVGQSGAPINPTSSYLAFQYNYDSAKCKSESPITNADKAGLASSHANSPNCASSYSSLQYSSLTSPQPTLFQVPPFSMSAGAVNGLQSNMPRHGATPTSPNTSPLPYGSFSLSARVTSSYQTSEVTPRSVGATCRKPPSHYVPNRSSKVDIMLDRKAFISLEKSINWQSLLSDASPLSSPSSSSSTPLLRQCAVNQATQQCTQSDGQARDSWTSSLQGSPQLSPLTSPVCDTGQGRQTFQGNCSSGDNLNPSSPEREFTLPGMKDVPAWLKLLRLHKYAPFFSHMSYEEMLELTEDVLEHRNITKGARQKLILSIQKLKARSAVLLSSEHELVDGQRGQYRYRVAYTSLSQVLFQIRAFLSTPIRPGTKIADCESSHPLVSSVCSPSVSCSSLYSLCSSPSSSVSLSPPFLASTPVDVNNNSPHQHSGSSRQAAVDHKELLRCWSSLANNNLSDIMTRLIGHMHHILVGKCKKRLKKLKLWQEYFKDIFDKLSVVSTEMNMQQERDVYERYSRLDNDSEPVNNSNYSDREENEEDEDSGLLDFYSTGLSVGQEGHSPPCTPNGTDKDSGVEEANDEANGDIDNNRTLHSDILTLDQEEELYMVMRTVLDKCLSHEAFSTHQTLFVHWREQLNYMINALRYMVNDSATALHRTGSPITGKTHSNAEYCLMPSRYSSKSPAHHCFSSNGLTKHKLTTNLQSCKKSPNSNYPKTSPSPSYSASLSAGRRLLHNRLRSSINHGTSPISNGCTGSTFTSSAHRNGLALGSSLDEKASRLSLDRRSLGVKLPSKSDSPGVQSGSIYSNLSVIPQLSNLFSSPIALNFHPSAAYAGNSPEANLRNLLLQQLLTTQQQQQPQAQAPLPGEASPHSSVNTSSQPSPVGGTIDYNGAAVPVTASCPAPGSSAPAIKSPSSIDSCQFSVDTAASDAAKSSQLNGEDGTVRPIDSTKHPLGVENGANLWSLNPPLDNLDAKKFDWNATGLLSSLDYCNNGGKLEDMLTLLDNNLDMRIGWPDNCPTSRAERITFDDIEQLCIRMAEHALEINDDSIYS